MARLTKGTFLMDGGAASGTAAWGTTPLVDITEYPDLNEVPDTEDVTTMSDPAHTYIPALPDSGGSLEFSTWLSAADGAAIDAMADVEHHLAVWIGGTEENGVITPTGSVLKRTFKGYVNYIITGAGTAEAAPATVVVTPSSAAVNVWGQD